MKKAVVLGGTSPHVDLINNLKQRGYYTILVDYLPYSPGVEVADRHIQESTLDDEKVLEIAEREKADLVISACIDQANSVCCHVAEKLGLPKPYSYQTSLNVTDKGRMKKIMAGAGIPTSPYMVVDSIEGISWDEISYPAVVKPVDCYGSRGVHRADTKEEVIKYVKEDLSYGRVHNAIIEGYVAGEEIQVDCFATDVGAYVWMTRRKKKFKNGNDLVIQSTGSVIPAALDEKLTCQAEDIAGKIATAFGLKNTPFFYQAILTEQGICVLEFAPRIGGGLSYYLLKEVAGVDSIDCAINSFLGVKMDVRSKKIEKCYSTNLLYMKPGTFARIEGMEELEKDHTIITWFQNKKAGAVIDDELRSGNRVGAFVVEGCDFDELRRKERKAYQSISVLNDEGENVLLKKLYEDL